MDDTLEEEQRHHVANEQSIEIQVRRAKTNDKSAIDSLIVTETMTLTKCFGEHSSETLIENSYLSIIALDDENSCLGYVAFDVSPSAETKSDVKFETFALKSGFTARNSIWMIFFKSEKIIEDLVRNEVFHTVFATFPQVDYILFRPIENGDVNFFPINDTDKKFQKKIDEDKRELYYIERELFNPKLKVRMGKVEDNDDLGPLLGSSKNLTTMQTEGEFFIADLLHHQSSKQRVAIATVDEKIVGLMYLKMSDMEEEDLSTSFKIGEYDDYFKDEHHYEINAIEIKIFFIKPEFVDRSIDFLSFAFDIFPSVPYACIQLPFTEIEHPLLEQFICVDSTDECKSNEALYILPRASFTCKPFVVEAREATDHESIANTLKDNEFSENFIQSVNHSYHPDKHLTTMLMFDYNSKDQDIVGVCVLDHQVNEVKIRRYYEADEYIMFKGYENRMTCQASILHIYLDPKHYKQANVFLQEMLRKMSKSILYYSVKSEETPDSTLNREMIRLQMRRQIELPWDNSVEEDDEDGETIVRAEEHDVYDAMYFINRRLLSERKTEIHTRIVVVGASKTGLSFIRTLTQYPYLFFSNITLISPEDIDSIGSFFSNTLKSEYDDQELWNLVRLPNVRFIQDRVEDIDRVQKRAVCVTDAAVPYDLLILTTSRQFKLDKELTERETFPENGVINLQDKDASIESLKEYIEEFVNDISCILVYGATLDAFGTAFAIINELEVHPTRVMMVFPEGCTNTFTDPNIVRMIEETLSEIGIKFYNYYTLHDFGKDEYGNLMKVFLMSTEEGSTGEKKKKRARVLEIPCSLFINCHSRDIDDDMLATINRESLVFDERLIVEPNFLTTDKSIYAAGPIAKFSRRFGVSHPMENYNSSEVGALTAAALLRNIGIEGNDDSELKLPTFKKKLSLRCPIPGGIFFYKINTTDFKPEQCSQIFTSTFEVKGKENRYVSLYINKKTSKLDCYCYLGEETIEQNNLSSLVGIPITYLNNLVSRHSEGLVPDLLDYLRENWVLALFCAQFGRLQEKLKKELCNHEEVETICRHIGVSLQRGSVSQVIDSEALNNLSDKVSAKTRHFVEGELLRFIHLHQNQLENIPLVYYVPPDLE